jgi:hypothetical protein
MTIATLRFNIDDADGERNFHLAIKGRDAIFALHDFDEYLRGIIKYDQDEAKSSLAEVFRTELRSYLEDRNINLDALVS